MSMTKIPSHFPIFHLIKISKLERCERSFEPREQEASCTGAKWGCTGAKEGLGGAKDSWETFAPWAQKSQKDLLHPPPPTTFGDFPFLGNFPVSQHSKPSVLEKAKTCVFFYVFLFRARGSESLF